MSVSAVGRVGGAAGDSRGGQVAAPGGQRPGTNVGSGCRAAQGQPASGFAALFARGRSPAGDLGARPGVSPLSAAEGAARRAAGATSLVEPGGEHPTRTTVPRDQRAGDDLDDREQRLLRADDKKLDGAEVLHALDPMARSLRQGLLAPQAVASGSERSDTVAEAARVSLDHVLSRLVRRIAWSGDAHAGSARIEFGSGALEGATLTLHAAGGDLRVSLDLPPGVDGAAWKERIGRRLAARGLQVSSLEVG